jgi:septal ring factor EnvC (AmiA/AmiB activator)
MKSSKDAASAPWDLSEMLEALEAGILQLRQERDKLRKELEELRRQAAIQQPNRSKRARNGRNRPRSRAQQKHSKKNDPLQTPAVKSDFPIEPRAPRKTKNALGRTLTQLRANRDFGHLQ